MRPNADLGAKINKARQRAGLTISELARMLDVSRVVVSDIVSGKRSPTPGIAHRLVQILDLDETIRQDLAELAESTYTSSVLDGTMRLDKYEKR